jgi:hypothetical protein
MKFKPLEAKASLGLNFSCTRSNQEDELWFQS